MSTEIARSLVLPAPLTADEATSYAALGTDAVWWESHGDWSSFRGEKAADALNGLITNDVSALNPGEGMHAAALTPKGKLVTDMLVIRVDATNFLMTVLRSKSASWLDLARKYVNPRLCTITNEADRFRTWMVYGTRAPQAIAGLGGGDATVEQLSDGMVSVLSQWPTWHHAPWNLGRVTIRLIRAPLMGTRPGFILMADSGDAEHVQQRLDAAPLHKGTRDLWNVSRVEAGRPAMGLDMDDNTIPQEANLDSLGAISYTKGCYTGQETVARLHFRGHVNRRLRGLASDAPMAQGADVVNAEGKVVGDVRSSVLSPGLGAIAMAMIRREVEAGDVVTVRAAGASVNARVVELPFRSDA
jgi:folate-binding protein YgfZ